MNPVLLQTDLDVLLNVGHRGSKPKGEFHRFRDTEGVHWRHWFGLWSCWSLQKQKILERFFSCGQILHKAAQFQWNDCNWKMEIGNRWTCVDRDGPQAINKKNQLNQLLLKVDVGSTTFAVLTVAILAALDLGILYVFFFPCSVTEICRCAFNIRIGIRRWNAEPVRCCSHAEGHKYTKRLNQRYCKAYLGLRLTRDRYISRLLACSPLPLVLTKYDRLFYFYYASIEKLLTNLK